MPQLIMWGRGRKRDSYSKCPDFRKCIRPHWSRKRDLEKKFRFFSGGKGREGSNLGVVVGVPFHAD